MPHPGTKARSFQQPIRRFRMGRSNRPVEPRIRIVERHLNLPLAGRSSALIGQPGYTTGTVYGSWNLPPGLEDRSLNSPTPLSSNLLNHG